MLVYKEARAFVVVYFRIPKDKIGLNITLSENDSLLGYSALLPPSPGRLP
jgi:hypothetical protein